MVAGWSFMTGAVETGNVPEVVCGAIVTVGGILTAGTLPARVTAVPRSDAALEMVTVQVVLVLAAKFAAAHCRPVTVAPPPASKTVVVFVIPLRPAVMVAV